MRMSLNTQIIWGALLGLAFGFLLQRLGADTWYVSSALAGAKFIGSLFVGLLKMIVVPLIFCSMVVGVANLRQHQHLHRVWRLTLLFFVFSMALAMILALLVANVVRPGEGVHVFDAVTHGFVAQKMTIGQMFTQLFQGMLVNPFSALAKGEVLPIVVFALLLGSLLVSGGERYRHLHALFSEGLALSLHAVNWVMKLAPLGISALLVSLVTSQQVALLSTLSKFIVMIIGTTLFHGLVILPLVLYLFTGKSPLWFLQGARSALITACATSSSSATLPVSLRCVTQQLGVKAEIAEFVLPLGATVNMDGTALYEAATALFVANLAGIDLSLGQQIVVFVVSMLSAIGAPGIPSAGMVTMIAVLQAVGLPTEAIAILLPIDRLLDTVRTAVNVEGDMVGSVVVEKWTSANTEN